MATVMDADAARERILAGDAPSDLQVRGDLDLSAIAEPLALPNGLDVRSLKLNQSSLTELPDGLRCFDLDLSDTPIETLPDDLRVERKLIAQRCHLLTHLPRDLTVGSLDLTECVHLEALPEGLRCWFLDLSGCTALRNWPERSTIGIGGLSLRGCHQLVAFPPGIRRLATLDVSGLRYLQELPEGLRVGLWIDVADTGLTRLPSSLAGVELRWRGVAIDARIAFKPDRLNVADAFAERNAERRRVMLERIGPERLVTEANVDIRDQDTDPGGPRRLLRIHLKDTENLVFLHVRCPSTGREYFLRVPPVMKTCHQAAAWTAGFDNPDDYRPIIET